VTYLSTSHDPLIVLLSILVAVVASFVSLDVAERLRGAAGRNWWLWLSAAGVTLGGGIWSMHFIAMLSYSAPVHFTYDIFLTLVSLLLAIGSTMAGYFVAAHRSDGKALRRRDGVSEAIIGPRLLLAGGITGAGVGAMHYTGMAALIVQARIEYDAVLVGASLAVAVVAATAAFWLSLKLDRAWHKAAAALVMGGAITGMHYTGMAAVRLVSDTHFYPSPFEEGTPATLMAGGLAVVTMLILAIGFISAIGDRHLDRKSQQAAVHHARSESRFEAIVTSMTDIILLLDRTGQIIYASPALGRILGFATEEPVGRPFAQLVPPDSRSRVAGLLSACLEHGGEPQAANELPMRNAAGDNCFMDMTVRNLLDDPHLNALVVKLHDVTDKKRIAGELLAAKERAEAASRAKSTFLANVSHELRTPLNSIIGFSDLLLAQPNGPMQESYVDFARDINASGKQLLTVINSILEYSRAESGSLELDSILVEPMAEAEACRRLHQEQIRAKALQVTLEPFDGHCLLLADRSKLRQIFIHLISNAVKFTPEGGRIRIAGEVDATGGCILSVQDSGIGMSEDEIAQALQPFHQAQGGLSRSFEGTGLGLPLTRALVSLHNGELLIESARGVGTLVQVRFPRDRVKIVELNQNGAAAS
jgi:PAS domain S-box-containing protein